MIVLNLLQTKPHEDYLMINFKTKPHRAVSFVESAILKAAESAGSLIAEIKYDGFRGNLVVDNENEGFWAEFCTRESTEVPALAYLAGENADRWASFMQDQENPFPGGVMIDGELMVRGVNFQTGSGLLRTKWLKVDNAEFHSEIYECNTKTGKPLNGQYFKLCLGCLDMVVYDIVPLEVIKAGTDYDVPTVVRVEHAKHFVKLLKKHFPEINWMSPTSFDVFSIESLHMLYNDVREQGHEGLIVKDPFAPYRRGKKTGMWKMKPEDTVDGTVVGINWGTPGLANEGKVIGFDVLLENGMVVAANGISQALMDEFTAKVKEDSLACGIGGNEPCFINPFEGWQCQVKFMEWTPDGSLRHPSFDGWRGTEGNEKVKV